MIIVFEGADKVGKTTLIKELHKATGYKHIIIDRFTASAIAYGKYRKRKLDYDSYLDIEQYLSDKVIMIYCYTDIHTQNRRIKSNNEKDIGFTDIQPLNYGYRSHLLLHNNLETLKIDTAFTVPTCIKKIKNAINKFENRTIFDKVERIKDMINKNGLKSLKTSFSLTSIFVIQWIQYL